MRDNEAYFINSLIQAGILARVTDEIFSIGASAASPGGRIQIENTGDIWEAVFTDTSESITGETDFYGICDYLADHWNVIITPGYYNMGNTKTDIKDVAEESGLELVSRSANSTTYQSADGQLVVHLSTDQTGGDHKAPQSLSDVCDITVGGELTSDEFYHILNESANICFGIAASYSRYREEGLAPIAAIKAAEVEFAK